MAPKKWFCFFITALVLSTTGLRAADSASFVDLGFSPDGRYYMFAQYGVQYKTWKPWVDLSVVDVPRNDFVNGGRVSYSHEQPVAAGQDGSGILYWFLMQNENAALARLYKVDPRFQGKPLYIAMDNGGFNGEAIDFRDFENGSSYIARLVSTTEGAGANLRSAFYINLDKRARDGARKTYTVGTPHLKRPLVSGYRIKKVIAAPQDGSLIFVIEMAQSGEGGVNIRYMVEAVRL